MCSIEFSTKANKEYKNLKKSKEKVWRAVSFAVEDLKLNPFIGEPLGRELKQYYSYHASGYRIVYKIFKKDKTVLVVKVRPRSVVYN